MNTRFHKKLVKKHEEKVHFSKQQAARSHILYTEASGFLQVRRNWPFPVCEVDSFLIFTVFVFALRQADGPLEETARITQKEVVQAVDLQSQAKHFQLNLNEFGPYSFQYTRNGRFLMLYGKQGHVSTFDWLSKDLKCEFHVQERINAGQWLHQETLFALAQKQWLHIYDNRGVEIHCVKKLFQILSMDFLPYHFLLATGKQETTIMYM